MFFSNPKSGVDFWGFVCISVTGWFAAACVCIGFLAAPGYVKKHNFRKDFGDKVWRGGLESVILHPLSARKGSRRRPAHPRPGGACSRGNARRRKKSSKFSSENFAGSEKGCNFAELFRGLGPAGRKDIEMIAITTKSTRETTASSRAALRPAR